VLSESYIFLPNVGPVLEKRIWELGCRTWAQALGNGCTEVLPAAVVETLCYVNQEFQTSGRAPFLAGLAVADQWRALCLDRQGSDVRPSSWLALDIETTGNAPGKTQITVIGVCGHATDFQPRAFVNNKPGWADGLFELFRQTDVLITFNGRSFDMPCIRAALPGIPEPRYHLDLFPVFKKLGLGGGLKKLQEALGFHRGGGIRELDGYSAVLLWRDYRHHRRQASLDTLVRYCLEDVVVLLPMAELAYNRMAESQQLDWICWPSPWPSLDDFPFDPQIAGQVANARLRFQRPKPSQVTPEDAVVEDTRDEFLDQRPIEELTVDGLPITLAPEDVVDETDPVAMMFLGRSFMFTGRFTLTTRTAARRSVLRLGGFISQAAGRKLDYLVVGESLFSDAKVERLSTKLRRVLERRRKGSTTMIIRERDFLLALKTQGIELHELPAEPRP
jgi:uncharacterized protein YprB with RNaseH-like and TPR domain